MVQIIQTPEEFNQTLQENTLVFVDFFAEWCGPCRAIAPVLQKFEEELIEQGGEQGPGVKFIKVDVDNNSDLAIKYGISAMPTFIMFKNGEQAKSLVGANVGGIRELVFTFLKETSQSTDIPKDDSPVEDEEVEVVA